MFEFSDQAAFVSVPNTNGGIPCGREGGITLWNYTLYLSKRGRKIRENDFIES